MRILHATDADVARWDTYVTAHPEATGYHAWAWRGVMTRAFGHEPIYIAAEEAGALTGVLPLVSIHSALFGRSLTSLPFLNYGGVLADSDGVAEQLVEAAGEVARSRHCAHVELRHVRRRLPSRPCRQHKVTMLLTLQEGMWDQLDRKVRNQIRKAQKSGLTVQVGGPDLLAEFYAVFARNMRDLGTPVYGARVFEEILRTFPERTAIHVVKLADRPVAGGLTFRHRDTVEVPWASSIRDFNALCPNHLLYWNVLERAVADGARVLDFGRSTPGEGTFRFKEQWGAMPVPLHWEYQVPGGGDVPALLGPANPKFRLAIEMWKRLPLPVATTLGPHIVRSIP